jgi:hypothetical protein
VRHCSQIIELPALLAGIVAVAAADKSLVDHQDMRRLTAMYEFGKTLKPTGSKLLDDAQSELNVVLNAMYAKGLHALQHLMTAIFGPNVDRGMFFIVAENPVQFYMKSSADCQRVMGIDSAMWEAWRRDLAIWRHLCKTPAIIKDALLMSCLLCRPRLSNIVALLARQGTTPATVVQCSIVQPFQEYIRSRNEFSVLSFTAAAALMDVLASSFRGAAMIANFKVNLHKLPTPKDMIKDGLDETPWPAFVQVFDECICGHHICRESLAAASGLLHVSISVHCTMEPVCKLLVRCMLCLFICKPTDGVG